MNKFIALLSITVATLFLYGCGIKGPLYIEKDPQTQTQKVDDEQQLGTQENNQTKVSDGQSVLY
ncbi:LPS translocon maturation chaperone LptM [Succinivibrio dextrinosolvens]|uniref:Lipoprotein-attachment site-containing protein n=1 Tax=Succinivibrio dextrinosolvens TaxID=83771 RepID=A0A662Z7D2_9GAMM|nr:lipoprotein [Succinivibrio dextrinosolvens]SFJ90617.1 lipoprotein-attachment site-containing protein [Succinivibrio dextrinosolvens]